MGSGTAAHNVGMHYLQEANPRDIKEAISWLEKASERGFFHSTYNLGLIYYQGDGVNKDLQLAKKYFLICLSQDQDNQDCSEYLRSIEFELQSKK